MLETSKKLADIGDEMNVLISKMIGTPETLKEMSQEEFKMIQLIINYISESNKLIVEVAELLTRIDKRMGELASK